jgi:hypothetical protein
MISADRLSLRYSAVGMLLLLARMADSSRSSTGSSTISSNIDSSLTPPFVVGEIQQLPSASVVESTSGATKSDAYAAHVRLPWVLTAILGDYFRAAGIDEIWRDLLKKDSTEANVTHVMSGEGGTWQFLAPNVAAMSASNFCYMFANDQEMHNRLLSFLGHAGMDSFFQSLGQEWGSRGITIFSMGFMGATHSEPGATGVLQAHLKSPIQSDTTLPEANQKPRAVQLLVPLSLKAGSRPELQMELPGVHRNATMIKLKQEMDVGVLFEDTTNYGPGQFDYRDSPDEMFVAFAIHFWVHQDNDIEIPQAPTTPSVLPMPSFALEWLQKDINSHGYHWNRDDPSVSLLNPPPIQSLGQLCNTSATTLATTQNNTARKGQVCLPHDTERRHGEEQEDIISIPEDKELFFWSHADTYNWSHWVVDDFHNNLECDQYFDDADDTPVRGGSKPEPQRRQPPSQEVWVKLRTLYKSIVGPELSTLPPDENEKSFYVNVITKPSVPGRGRGVFANQFIPKGTIVYTPKQQARFTNVQHFKQFVMSVSVDLSCDLLAWMSIQKVVVDNIEQSPQIVFDLDDGSLVNGGSRLRWDQTDVQSGEIANVGCIPELAKQKSGGCSMNDFSLRDIYVGEELLIDYSEFVIRDNEAWAAYGLIN